MSVCAILAADCPLPTVEPAEDYPLHINIDTGVIDDGGADGNYSLSPFPGGAAYTGRSCNMELQMHYTPGRANRLIAHIREALARCGRVELWQVWLMEPDELTGPNRPEHFSAEVSIDDLTPEDIRDLLESEVFPKFAKTKRPRFYCLRIVP